MAAPPQDPGSEPRRASFGALLLLIAAVTAVRLLYLFLLCPYDLVEDEATYWEWSRRLDWSYYTKGPGIALAIRAATELLGDSEAAIRTVSVIASAVAALFVGLLGAHASRRRDDGGTLGHVRWDVGLVAASLFLLIPVFQAIGLLATIDGPYIACWAAASFAAFMVLERRRVWYCPLFGLAVGLGFLFKYTILLLLPGILLYVLLRPREPRTRLALPPRLLGVLLMLAGFAPVLIWNQQNGWPTVAHLLGHLGVKGGDMPAAPPAAGRGWSYDPRWTLDFVGTQIGIVGPALILGLGVAWKSIRIRRRARRALRASEGLPPSPALDPSWPPRLFLIACSAPILIFYLAVSFMADPEGNWAIGGYVTLAALGAWGAVDAVPEFRRRVAEWEALPEPRPRHGFFRKRPELFEVVLWHWSIAVGVVAAISMARVDLIAPLIPGGAGRIGSVITADVLARDAERHAAALTAETGREAFYIAQHYGRASIMAYYIPRHPAVRCSSSRMAGRRTQYDYWADTDLDDPSLLGRPAVLVGAVLEQWQPLFERVVPAGRLEGEHKKERELFFGYGYKGWSTSLSTRPGH